MRQEVIQKAPERAKKQTPNLTGIPTQMKLDFERRSGLSFDDVRVHYNSDKPRKIGALAYTQIPQVHIGPGQERHLRHELGHVVQQKRGIVRSTTKMGGTPVNTEHALEREADLVFSNNNRQPVSLSYNTNHNLEPPGQTIQGKFCEVLSFIKNKDQLEEVLLCYPCIKDEDRKKIVDFFHILQEDTMPFYTVGQICNRVLKMDDNFISDEIKEQYLTLPSSSSETVTLYRADTRCPHEIHEAKGFWGRGSGAISAAHARWLIPRIKNPNWVDQWKRQTKGKTEWVPYIATGEMDQKSGHVYSIKVRLTFEEGSFIINPKYGTDTGDLQTARIIALKMNGPEVIFLTGVPEQFIYYNKEVTGGRKVEYPLREYVDRFGCEECKKVSPSYP